MSRGRRYSPAYRRRNGRDPGHIGLFVIIFAAVFMGAVALMNDPEPAQRVQALFSATEPARTGPVAQYFPNCDAARAAGAAPIGRGQPGYRLALDRDRDGIACEPYRGF